jgi:alpha-1,3-rhamnosyltransferase
MNQENMPLVTAVIPVYNHEPYVVESLRSIINQTYRNIELIVINDGSKDRSHEKVLTLVEECRQRFVRFEYIDRDNMGLSATLNQALSLARGKYFTPLASDDRAFPEKFELLVKALEAKGQTYAAAFGNALFIDDKGQEIRLGEGGRIVEATSSKAYDNFLDFYTAGQSADYKGEKFGTYQTLIRGNYLPAMSTVVRTAAISEVGGWTPGNVIDDWELWLKLARKYKFLYVDEPVAFYRCHALNTAKDRAHVLALSALAVIDGEKKFCAENNLIPLWKTTRNEIVYRLLLMRKVPLSKKFSLGMSADKAPLLLSAMSHIGRKLRALR